MLMTTTLDLVTAMPRALTVRLYCIVNDNEIDDVIQCDDMLIAV